jgi:hypothetical protein
MKMDNATVGSSDGQLTNQYPPARISGALGLKWWVNLFTIIGGLGILIASAYMFNMLKLTTLLLAGASPEQVIPLASFVEKLEHWSVIAIFTTELIYLCWVYRAYKNLSPLTGSKTQWSAWWAAIAVFVPILGIWRPAEVLAEIWRKSCAKDTSLNWGSKVIWAWWSARITFIFLWNFLRSQVRSAGSAPGPDISHFMNALRYYAYGHILWVIVTLGGILLLWRMTRMQQEMVISLDDKSLKKEPRTFSA